MTGKIKFKNLLRSKYSPILEGEKLKDSMRPILISTLSCEAEVCIYKIIILFAKYRYSNEIFER